MNLTPQQVVQARRLLGWSQAHLAVASGVGLAVLGTFERIGRIPRRRAGGDYITIIRGALEAGGVEFSTTGDPALKKLASASLTPAQCVAARRLLGWSQGYLAAQIGSNATAVSSFERWEIVPRGVHWFPDWRSELQAVLQAAGIEFRPQLRANKPQATLK